MNSFCRTMLFVFTLLSFTAPAWAIALDPTAIEGSSAYERYERRRESELSKLVFLLDRFQAAKSTVFVGGREYDSKEAGVIAKKYMRKHYDRKQEAQSWIKEHCYRLPSSGDLIHFRDANGDLHLLRDVLLTELSALEVLV